MSVTFREKAKYRLIQIILLIRPFFVKTGIELFVRKKIHQWLEKKYGHIDIFETKIQDKDLKFTCSDSYSKEWFFPRYDGGRIHEETVTMLLVDTLKETAAKCFVDVGTNLGWYSCLANVFMQGGTVYGFEMDDLNFDLVKKNVEMNGGNSSDIFHMAVSDSPGEISYVRNSSLPSPEFKMSSDVQNSDKKNVITVQSISLDSFFQEKTQKPDVIKVDVEGAEIKVLRGMRELLKNSAPKLFVEVHPHTMSDFQSSVEQVISFIIDNGYKVFEIENLRSHGAGRSLRELNATSKLYYNAMLYAYKP